MKDTSTPGSPRSETPLISVLVPVYNEAESLPHLHPRIVEAFDTVAAYDDGVLRAVIQISASY